MPTNIIQSSYNDTAYVAVGQIIYDVPTVSTTQPFHDLPAVEAIEDVSASYGVYPSGFASVRWRLDMKFNLSSYSGSLFRSALPKADLGTLCICSSGAVVEEIRLNYEVQATGVYCSYSNYPITPYPSADIIAHGTGVVDVMYSQGYTPDPTATIGDEFYLLLTRPDLLEQFVCNYYVKANSLDATVGITNLSMPF